MSHLAMQEMELFSLMLLRAEVGSLGGNYKQAALAKNRRNFILQLLSSKNSPLQGVVDSPSLEVLSSATECGCNQLQINSYLINV